jgi:undecaprenyl diphosphate synthase
MEILRKFKRLPRHVAIIPDGNRRWAESNGLEKHEGYDFGIMPGLITFDTLVNLGVEEITFFGFTLDNTKRPEVQRKAFQIASVNAVKELMNKDTSLLVVGKYDSDMFPKELLQYKERVKFGTGKTKLNFLVNYGWNNDLSKAFEEENMKKNSLENILSKDISKIDLVIRPGGRRRLSGMLPIQTVYSDIYVTDKMWPEITEEDIYDAIDWYQNQDITLGG